MTKLTKTEKTWIAFGAIASIGIGAFLWSGNASAAPKKAKCHPFKLSPDSVAIAIESAIGAGARRHEAVARKVGLSLYPGHPTTGKPLAWPPTSGASKAQLCAWDRINAMVDSYFDTNPIPACPAGMVIGPTGFCEGVPPPPPPEDKDRHPGNPPRGNTYDADYWGSNRKERLISIRKHFADLGYNVVVSAHPMNVLGPDGLDGTLMDNFPGSVPAQGRLGGNDDKPNQVVGDFQSDYNAVSYLNDEDNPQSMGGVNIDDFVGPYTLNALRYAKENLLGIWQDLVTDALQD